MAIKKGFHTAASQSFVMLIELVMLSLNNFTEVFVMPFELVMCSPYELLCVVN